MRLKVTKWLTVVQLILLPLIGAAEMRQYPEIINQKNEMRDYQLLGLKGLFEEHPTVSKDQVNTFLQTVDKTVFLLKDQCSAVFVSDTGHALTALHCLDQSMHYLPNPIYLNSQTTIDGKSLSFFSSKQDMIGTTYSLSDHGGSVKLELGGATELTILAMGSGYPYPNSDWDDSLLSQTEVMTWINTQNEDYALIKYDKVPDGMSCVKTSTVKTLSPNDILWVAGYPRYASRGETPTRAKMIDDLMFPSEHFDDEFSKKAQELYNIYRSQVDHEKAALWREEWQRPLYLSVGRYFNYATGMAKAMPVPYRAIKYLDEVYDNEKYFFNTALSGSGMSGGGVFNIYGQLIGINNAKPGNLVRIYPKGLAPGTIHLSIDFIKKAIESKLGKDLAESAFSCSQK